MKYYTAKSFDHPKQLNNFGRVVCEASHNSRMDFYRGCFRLLRAVFPTLILGFSPMIASGQQVQPRDADAITHLQSALNAMGSRQITGPIKGVLIQGTIWSSDESSQVGTFSSKLTRGKFLVESNTNEHHIKYGGSGKSPHFQRDGTSVKSKSSGVSDVGSDLFPFFERWSSFSDQDVGVRHGTDRTIDGIACSEIIVSLHSQIPLAGHPTYDVSVFVRKDNGLLRAVEYPVTSTAIYNPRFKNLVVYDGYQSVGGINLPTTIKRYLDRNQLNTLHITTIDIHQTFDDSVFEF